MFSFVLSVKDAHTQTTVVLSDVRGVANLQTKGRGVVADPGRASIEHVQ